MELPVIVEKVIFQNEKGFAILACSLNPYSSKYKEELEVVLLKNINLNKYNNFTITTSMFDPHEKAEGRQYIFIGDFIKHEKYGEQFKSEFYYQDRPSTEEGLRVYLMSLPNIKEARSSDILKTFGVEETIRILDKEPSKLIEINGITEKRIPPIKIAWDRDRILRELYIWLNDHGISPQLGKKIYATWGDNSFNVLNNNPYQITDIKGFGFVKADFIAHKISKSVNKEARTVACMKYVLTEDIHKNSNLCMPYSSFAKIVLDTLKKGNEQNNPTENIQEYTNLIPLCIKKNLDTFVAIKNIGETNNGAYIYLKEIWDKEKFIATSIYKRRVIESEKEGDNSDLDQYKLKDDDLIDAEKDVSKFSQREVKLDESQKEAIRSAFNNRITVITGAGGTGKSTICRCIYHLSEEKKLSVRMMSPTGKAARVLSNKTSFPAETIHRSLKMKPGDDLPSESIREDMVIIDEVSMVGIDTMFAVFSAIEENVWAHIVFVGDCNQLPSVSPGNFLFDIMQSGCVNIVRLDKIHRQDENSYIPLLANDISNGKVVEIPKNASDIAWHSLSSLESFDNAIKNAVSNFMKGNNIEDLQFLAPMYRGEYGINKVNEIVQNYMMDYNKSQNSLFQKGFIKLYVGDRVIQTENNYSKSIFNGDMGRVVEAGRKAIDPSVSDEQKDFVIVNFYGENLTYVDEEIEQLKLAWCCSVHKFQGSQSPYVVFVFPGEASIMASKEILYTAMTRAEKKLDIYGHMQMFKISPTKSVVRKRYTNMNNIIKEVRDNKKIFKILEMA